MVIDIEISPKDLKPTKDGFLRVFWKIYRTKKSVHAAYHETEGFFAKQGYENCFPSFEAFKMYYYRKK